MTSAVLRKKFLDFFKVRKHRLLPSDLLVPRDDPTVLFTPAGMNQFKKEFMGHDSGFSRAATCQRCLRTDDLDKVGKTSGHHTFFEMLGNFSFGDYFKEEAITWAWEFLTKELKLPPDKLRVSVYRDDDEAYRIWRDTVGIAPERIVRLGDKENFWPAEAKEKGPNGPCGPCSEIFFDSGSSVGCGKAGCSPACSCGRFLEVWNLVFTQFNRLPDGKLEPLPQKNIDTGMGLERLAAVMQGVQSNFETDLFKATLKEIALHSAGDVGGRRGDVYAVADHIRAIVFAIYDGVLPSHEARGYVVRKLIRKSVLHLRTLGISKPFLCALTPLVAESMGPAYPDLKERQENIAEVILAEEQNFISILDSSASLLKETFGPLLGKPDPEEAGRRAFQLHDTYGVPLELTGEWLKKHGITMSREAFDRALGDQKERSKSMSAMKGDVFGADDFDYGSPATKFSGYREHTTRSNIFSLAVTGSGGKRLVKKISAGSEAAMILDKTPFYAESGGQVGDTGVIEKGRSSFSVTDTRKVGKIYVHYGKVTRGSFKLKEAVTARIDAERRLSVERNHTATHMLQAALRNVLGAHIRQQGSLVAPDRLRFDFTHFKDISAEQIARVEELVNGSILSNLSLTSRQMTLAEAKKTGALAVFGEKYAERVRVVSIGDFSLELCGGTHLASTGQIGLFKILQEGSISSGVRRIEATTGQWAYDVVKGHERVVADLSRILQGPAEAIPREVEK
ncbi:MAG: alanine--tRNA ligase, partial [Candidatus Omnitrophica bacterium]|nr:alanine--tRNA ligase [Candidatus Omnitrophota bacterium]